MKKINCIIVEDEPIALEIIETYLKEIPEMNISGRCKTAMQAFSILKTHPVDLMFLDINMPGIGGLDFLKSLNNPPAVIITTAYREYGPEGFELDVIDYLLKPISFVRFMKAIDKFYQICYPRSETPSSLQVEQTNKEDAIFVRTERKMKKIEFDNILYLESLKDYVIIHTLRGKIITKQRIGYFEQNLPDWSFIRIHRSYIVAVAKISAVTKNSVEIGKRELPVSRSYKNIVFQKLGIQF